MIPPFWRPIIILVVAVSVLFVLANLIPASDNELFPIKKMNIPGKLAEEAPNSQNLQQKPIENVPPVANELTPISGFIDKLRGYPQRQTGSIRIAYFGDSIIEGDLISGMLRYQLQQRYGGSGIGLAPITSIVSEFRTTIRHRFSRNWETQSFMSGKSGNSSLGMIGYTFIPRNYYYAETIVEKAAPPQVGDSVFVDSAMADSAGVAPKQAEKVKKRFYVDGPAWVEYSGTKVKGGAQTFRRIRLFYSHASEGSYVNVIRDGGSPQCYQLRPSTGVSILDLGSGTEISKIRLEFNPLDPIHLYGVSFDDATGLYVDNLAVRGYSGLYFQRISKETLKDFNAVLDYDLIILQYGENVSSPNIRDYSNYRQGMIKTVRHIQSALPGVPILLISAHDRSVKQNGVMATSGDIPVLVEAQGEVARETGCGFWNLYEALGGYNSMQGLVKAKPALANRDYTHFTKAGADMVAELLFKVITTGQAQ
ncbi:MAG TPA: hypothetical protein PK726_02080 [Candidatus Cloacimonadota bacterium]|jgi:lysophospholipase L1-like esterase|nr:hypothetical protein [Candidatus Cloacimonadota bacterium]HQO44068.1 hypothetical protein [Candidatus Cloacimonadota bacterium]